MFLIKARSGRLFYFINLEPFTVGRKDCNLLITDDQSISREHAKLFLKNSKLILVDLASKYGTFVNREKILPQVEKELKSGDDIRFGQLRSFYSVEELTIITTTSSIKGNQKKDLATNISFLGGKLQSYWTATCTHVIVEEILLTVKVLCAVIKGIPIVTVKYWDDYVTNVKNNLPPPVVKDYKPVCSEVTLSKDVSLDYKPERLNLFKYKIFVFPTKNDKAKMVDMIRLAGGDAISWDIHPFTTKDLTNSKSEYIILEMGSSVSDNTEPTLSTIIECNRKLGKRTIPLQEIALAIIHCSCEKDCNPNFDRRGTVLAIKTQKIESQHTENILAMSTQTQNVNLEDYVKSEEIIQGTNEIKEMEIVEHKIPEPIKEEDIDDTSKFGLELQQMTKFKRQNETNGEISFNPPKKPKLETKDIGGNCLELIENPTESPGKGKFTFKSNLNVDSVLPQQKNINPFSLKRKIPPSDDGDNPAKRNAMVQDTPEVPNTINPFSFIRSKKSSCVSKDYAVPSTSKSVPHSNGEPNIASSTFINRDVSNSIRLDISAIAPVQSASETICRWLSKTKIDESKSSIVNSSVACPTSSSKDDDFTKYVQSFRNSVIVETEPLVRRRTSFISNGTHSLSSHNDINFKQFKKVQPRKIQTTIFPESSYCKVPCNEHGTVQIINVREESDEEIDLRLPARRRYVF